MYIVKLTVMAHVFNLIYTHTCTHISLSLSLYIYIYIYMCVCACVCVCVCCHPQTDCFVVSQFIRMAKHTGRFKLGLKNLR